MSDPFKALLRMDQTIENVWNGNFLLLLNQPMNTEIAFGRFADNSDSNRFKCQRIYFPFLKIDYYYYLPFEFVQIFVSFFNNICIGSSASYQKHLECFCIVCIVYV